MARATKERLERDAARFGLKTQPAKPSKYDAAPCVSCGNPLGMHTRAEIYNCAMARS